MHNCWLLIYTKIWWPASINRSAVLCSMGNPNYCVTFKTLSESGAGSFSLEITSLDSWKGKVTQLSLNSSLGTGFSVEYFFFLQKMGNTVGISWIGKALMDGRVLGFLDGSSTWAWQGHTILLMKMPSGQPRITQSAPLCSRAGMLGYNPAEVANRFKQTQIMLQHCCPAGKRQLPRGTLQPLLFIRKICEDVDLSSLLNPDLKKGTM